MDVAPHPHMDLQTVTWLLDREILHDDSLGCEAVGRPGGVNVMISGKGIARAEQTPAGNSGRLFGMQLRAALPNRHRNVDAHFESLKDVPVAEERGGIAQVFSGPRCAATNP